MEKLIAMFDLLLVEQLPDPEKSKGGIIMVPLEETPAKGKVILAGEDCRLKKDDIILYNRNVGWAVETDNGTFKGFRESPDNVFYKLA
jgi:co-chaperonin GroES (HSP10)